jgi:AcrR family transcriptional regulator
MRGISFNERCLILFYAFSTVKILTSIWKTKMSAQNEEGKPLKDQLKSETRRRLVEAGTRAFAKFGYHGMKVAAVAREAGIANGTFYLHFKDKQELFLEILRSAVGKLASGLFAVHGYGETSSNAERDEIAVVFEFAEQNRDLMRIALNTDSSELLKGVDIFAPIVEMRVKQLKKGAENGNLNRSINPLIAARAEIGMMLSVILWWLDNREKASKQDLIETLTILRRSWSVSDSNVDDIDAMLAQWDTRL